MMEFKSKIAFIVFTFALVSLLVLSGCTGNSESQKPVSSLVANQMGGKLSPDYTVVDNVKLSQTNQEAAQDAKTKAIFDEAYNQSVKIRGAIAVGQALDIISTDYFRPSVFNKYN